MNRTAEAIQSFEKAVALAPRTGGPARVVYAQLLRQSGALGRAIEQFEAGMDSDEMRIALPKLPRDFPSFATHLIAQFNR